jgi:hypothetical protein
VCNVTIQERGVEDFTSGGPPSSGGVVGGGVAGGVGGGGGSSDVSGLGLATSGSAVELAEAGWQRKKSEAEVTKPRYSKHKHVTQAHIRDLCFWFEQLVHSKFNLKLLGIDRLSAPIFGILAHIGADILHFFFSTVKLQ